MDFEKNYYSSQTALDVNKRVEQIADRLGFRDRIIYELKDIVWKSIVKYWLINNRSNYSE